MTHLCVLLFELRKLVLQLTDQLLGCSQLRLHTVKLGAQVLALVQRLEQSILRKQRILLGRGEQSLVALDSPVEVVDLVLGRPCMTATSRMSLA